MTATVATEWVVIPYGPDHRREMEALVGSEYDPPAGKYGLRWPDLRTYLPTVNGYGYLGTYLEAWQLPDGRVLICRTDKHLPMSKFRLFPSRAAVLAWVEEHNRQCPEIDPETGRPFRRN